MTRELVLATSVLSAVSMGCGGSQPDANSAGGGKDWVVLVNQKNVGDEAYKFPPTFAVWSQKHGCVVQQDETATLSKCSEGTIMMMREGTLITVGCKLMSTEACSQLFDAIVNEGKAP